LDSVCLVCIVFRIIWVFRISRYVYWTLSVFDKAIVQICSFMLFLIPCLLGFTFVVYIVYGPYIPGFHSILDAIQTVLYFTLGSEASAELVKYNIYIAVIWTGTFFLFLIFIFLSVFFATFVDSYMLTIKEQGYPSDIQEATKWEYIDYLVWMLDWLPVRLKKKLAIFKKE